MVASFTEFVFTVSFVFYKSFLSVVKRRNASPFIKPFLHFKGWQDENFEY